MKPTRPLATFANDHKRGMKAETRFIDRMKNDFSVDILKMSEYHFSDFICKELLLLFELKRRFNNKNKYPHTIIPHDKVKRFEKFNDQNGGKYLFIMVFHFNDGIFFFEHDPSKKYLIKPYVRFRRADFIDKKKDYIFIPIEELEPINNIKRYTDNKIVVRYNAA